MGRIWDSSAGECLQKLCGHGHCILYAEFSQDGSKVVTTSSDNTAKIWDSNTGLCLRTLAGEQRVTRAWRTDYAGVVRMAAINKDGTKVATGSIIGEIII